MESDENEKLPDKGQTSSSADRGNNDEHFVHIYSKFDLSTYQRQKYGLWSFPEGMPIIGQLHKKKEWTFGITQNGYSENYSLYPVRHILKLYNCKTVTNSNYK
jgi:hypothetical protein